MYSTHAVIHSEMFCNQLIVSTIGISLTCRLRCVVS